VTRSLFGIMTIAIVTAACGSSDPMPQVTAAAAPAAAPAAPAAPPAPSTPVVETSVPAPAKPVVKRSTTPATRTSERAERPRAKASAASAVPEYREFTLRAGTALPLVLRSAVASDESQVEDSVRATLRKAIVIDGQQVLPAGTELSGVVTDAARAGRVKGRARVAFQFSSLRYDGERHRIQTEAIEQLGEATKGEDAKKIGIGAGVGAAIGALAGGGSGAAKGAAIGAGAGTGVVLATRGKDVRLEPGTEVETRLTAPLAIRVPMER
jgi:hypothetical protein